MIVLFSLHFFKTTFVHSDLEVINMQTKGKDILFPLIQLLVTSMQSQRKQCCQIT